MSDARITRYSDAAARWAAQRLEDVRTHAPNPQEVSSSIVDLQLWAEKFSLFVRSAVESLFAEPAFAMARVSSPMITRFEPANEVGRTTAYYMGDSIDSQRYLDGFHPANETVAAQPVSTTQVPVAAQIASQQIFLGATHTPFCQIMPPPPLMIPPVRCCRP